MKESIQSVLFPPVNQPHRGGTWEPPRGRDFRPHVSEGRSEEAASPIPGLSHGGF